VSIRLVMVSVFCALLTNCATRPVPEMLAQSSVGSDGWGRAAEIEPARPKVRHVGQPAKSEKPISTRSTTASAADRDGITPLTPEWYAAEEADAKRLKRLTDICRC
jgi:hypothetical protein